MTTLTIKCLISCDIAAAAPAPAAPAAFAQNAVFHLPGGLVGIASWYGTRHAHRRTADGEIFSIGARTAAHPTLPFGTLLRVTNLRNHRSALVRVNDRGPYARGRMIDLSERAARDLGMMRAGLVPVRMEIVSAAPIGAQ